MIDTARTIPLRPVCPFCGKESLIEVDAAAYAKYLRGEGYIQDLFPDLSANDRELLKTGIDPECWERATRPIGEYEYDPFGGSNGS